MGKILLAGLGAVGAAIGSALCCVGPLVAVSLGVSGAGLAATFEPLRPYFLAGTLVLLGLGFGTVYREDRKACKPGSLCASPEVRRRTKVWLCIGTGIAIPLATFPWWSRFVLS